MPLNLIVTEVLIKISRNLKDSLQTLISFLSKRRGSISFTEILLYCYYFNIYSSVEQDFILQFFSTKIISSETLHAKMHLTMTIKLPEVR